MQDTIADLRKEYFNIYRNPPPSRMTKTQLREALDAHYFFMRWEKVCAPKYMEEK